MDPFEDLQCISLYKQSVREIPTLSTDLSFSKGNREAIRIPAIYLNDNLLFHRMFA